VNVKHEKIQKKIRQQTEEAAKQVGESAGNYPEKNRIEIL
jgi:hypothetical protein